MNTSEELKRELAGLLAEKEERQRYHAISKFFPDKGPYRRELYKKHIEFINKGVNHSQRAFIAGNRTGKSVTGAYETSTHLTGEYPKWWKGKKFKNAVNAWAASVSNEATKNIIQQELLGNPMDIGSGMIPKDKIVRIVKKSGVTDAIETVYVQHVSGGISRLDFKSYEQGRSTFQGTKKQVIWLDEEPTDQGIYTECLTRTAGGEGEEGIMYCTFTPLFGLSDVVKSFLPDGKIPENGEVPDAPYKFVTQVSWDEVPHISEQWKKETLATYSEYEKDARSAGRPALGSGAIYPYAEAEITVEPFEIPIWWPRAYGVEIRWDKVCALWGAKDPTTDTIYLYSEYFQGKEPPIIHSAGIRAKGKWIPGVTQFSADKRGKDDGLMLIDAYEKEGLDLHLAGKTVDTGIYTIGQLFATGKLKVFHSLRNFFSQFRTYCRDMNGQIIKKDDNLMDALRYLITDGMSIAECPPDPDEYEPRSIQLTGKSKITGY